MGPGRGARPSPLIVADRHGRHQRAGRRGPVSAGRAQPGMAPGMAPDMAPDMAPAIAPDMARAVARGCVVERDVV